MINENTRYDPKNCGLYKPGHKSHYVQGNVMRDKKRYQAKVELISPYSLRVTTRAQAEVLYHHDAVALQLKCLMAIDGGIQYCPESNLLYVKTNGPTGNTKGSWFPAYLSREELTMCESSDSDSGYFIRRGNDSDAE
jgi:tRNA(Leu) C34 or U34 (ribose-2'-O)-methylase TrmL